MPELALDTASASYAAQPARDLEARFDTAAGERREYFRERRIAPVLLTGGAMMIALTASDPMPFGLADWATPSEVVAVSGQTDRSAVLGSRLSAYRHLPANWDGEAGHAPSAKAIEEAFAFIDLLPLGTPMPTPFVAGDGEVGFHWKTPRGFADISFYGDGHIYYYAEVGVEVEGTEPYTGRAIPKKLAQALADL